MSAEFRFPAATARETATTAGHKLETIKERVKYLYNHMAFTDVNLWIRETGSEFSIPAHKAILSVGSHVFANIFFIDNYGRTSPSEVEIKNVDRKAFKKFVEFLYTDEVTFDSEEDVLKVFVVAEKFKVARLQGKCRKQFSTIAISSGTVCQTLQQSISLNIETMKARCLDFISKNTSKVLRSPSFEKANADTILAILELQELSMDSECEVLNAVTTWAVKQNQGQFSSARGLMMPLLPHIRFLAIPTSEFVDYLNNNKGIFTESEYLAIIMGISNLSLSSCNLPTWCSQKKSRCGKQQTVARPSQQATSRPSIVSNEESVTLELGLKKNKSSNVNYLRSYLEVLCSRDRFTVTGVKLKWRQLDSPDQCRLNLRIAALVMPSGFRVVEGAKDICDQEETTVNFSKIIYFGEGDTLKLEVIVSDAKGCSFMSYCHKNSKNYQDLPFVCTLDCFPEDCNFSLFSELHFQKSNYHSKRRAPPKRSTSKSTNAICSMWD